MQIDEEDEETFSHLGGVVFAPASPVGGAECNSTLPVHNGYGISYGAGGVKCKVGVDDAIIKGRIPRELPQNFITVGLQEKQLNTATHKLPET